MPPIRVPGTRQKRLVFVENSRCWRVPGTLPRGVLIFLE